MKYNATIIMLDGRRITLTEWQQIYGLEIGSKQIGKYFKIGEKDIKGAVSIRNNCTFAEALMRLMDEYRILKNKPVQVNDFDRYPEDIERLIAKGYKPAKKSTHLVFMAFDADTISKADTLESVSLLETAAQNLGYTIRIGYKSYLKSRLTVVHADVAPMYYAPGKIFHNIEHPKPYEYAARW